MNGLRIAWRNLGRNKRRTLLGIGAIAVGQFMLVFVNGMIEGWWDMMLDTITGPMAGHVTLHHPGLQSERAVDLTIGHLGDVRTAIRSLPAVRPVAPRLSAAALAAPGAASDRPAAAEPAMIVGLDPTVETRPSGLLAGLPASQRPGRKGVVLGAILASRLGLEAGDSLALIGQDADGFPANDLFTVRAVRGSNVDQVRRLGVLMSLSDAAGFLHLPDRAHEIVVLGDDPRHADSLAAAIAALPVLRGVEVQTWRQAVPELAGILDMRGRFGLIFLLIVFVAAAAGIANTATMSAFERTHEFGMLLAIGMRPARIVRMVLVESILIGLMGVAAGSLAGGLAVGITSHTGIDYAALANTPADGYVFGGLNISYVVYPRLVPRFIAMGIAGAALTCILASLWPALLAARLQPVEAMRT